MNRVIGLLVLGLIGLALLEALLPLVLALAHALVQLVLVGAVVALTLRVIWYLTNRY